MHYRTLIFRSFVLAFMLLLPLISNGQADAGEDQYLCGEVATLSGSIPQDTLVRWTVLSGSGLVIDPADPGTSINNLSAGINLLLYEYVLDDVVYSTDTVLVYRYQIAEENTISYLTCGSVLPESPNGGPFDSLAVLSYDLGLTGIDDSTFSASNISPGFNIYNLLVSYGNCAETVISFEITSDIIPVAQAGTNQTICSSSSQLAATPADGGVWTVVSGTGSFNDENLASASVSGLSVGSNVFRWTVPGGACADAFDQVSIVVDQPPTVSNAGNDQVICATSSVMDAIEPSTGEGTWSVVSGSAVFDDESLFNTAVSGLSTGENILRWTISNGVCPPSFDEVSVVVQDNPISPNAGPDQTICSSSTQLAANPAAGGAWSRVSGTGTFDDENLAGATVSGLSVGANVFRWTIPGGACADAFDEVSIVVDQPPTVANAGTDQTICATATVLNGNEPASGSGVWTVIAGSAVFDNENLYNTAVSGLSTGENILRWTISNGVCPPSFDEVSVVVQDNPISPNAGPDQTICSSSTQLAANPAAGGAWSRVSGTGTFDDENLAGATVSGLSVGANVFRWTIPGGACADAFDEVSIVVDQPPTLSNAGTDQTICATGTVLNGNEPASGSGVWTVIAGSAIFDNENLYNTAVSGLSTGENILRWTISNGVCPPSFDEVSVVVQDNPESPDAGTDQTICATSTQLAATPASGGVWSLVSGSGIISNSALANTTITGLSVGTNVFRWTIPGGACADAFDEVSIVVDQPPTVANAGTDQTICATATVLNGNEPASGSGVWTVIAGSAVFDNENLYNTAVSGLSIGENILRWTISNGVCAASFDQVSITVQDNPESTDAGTDQTICATSTQLAANPASGGVWSLVSGSGIISNSALANTTITGLSVGTNVFRWTIPGGACADAFDEVSIVVDQPPTVANAGTDQTICATATVLNGNEPASGSGVWTVIAGSAVFDNENLYNTAVSGLSTGENILRWTISNGVCAASFDQVSITVQDNPESPDAGTDQTICATSTQLAATPASGGVWSLVSGSGIISNSALANTTITGLSVGTNVFRWTIPGGACADAFDEVSIVVEFSPTNAHAGEDQIICATTSVLDANLPLVGTGTWTVISGTAIFSNQNLNTSGVSGLSVGNNILRWSISNGVCAPSFDDVIITVQDNPVSPNAGPDQTICSSSTQLAATAVAGGFWSVISGSGSISNNSLANASVSGMSAGINVFRWTIPGGSCADAFDEVNVLVDALPTNALAGPDQVICSTNSLLQGNEPLSGLGLWTIVSGSATFANPSQNNTSVSGLSEGINVLRWTISNGVCPPSSDEMVITVQDNPVNPNAGPDQTICLTNTQLAATPAPGGQWTIINGSGTFADNSLPNSTVNGLSVGTNVFRWTIPGGACPDVFDEVTIVVNEPPTASNAGSDQTICATTTTLAGNLPLVGSGFWTVVTGAATFANPSLHNTGVSGLSVGTNILRWTISNGVCPVSTDASTQAEHYRAGQSGKSQCRARSDHLFSIYTTGRYPRFRRGLVAGFRNRFLYKQCSG
jgi:hypothetical protein